jgi:hypothetical protein
LVLFAAEALKISKTVEFIRRLVEVFSEPAQKKSMGADKLSRAAKIISTGAKSISKPPDKFNSLAYF